jgi:hypothetical protein
MTNKDIEQIIEKNQELYWKGFGTALVLVLFMLILIAAV